MKNTSLYICVLLCLAACSEADVLVPATEDNKGPELTGVEAEVYGGITTRAAALDKDNYVGRKIFEGGDSMVLTNIRRTPNPIPGFSYTDIWYYHEVGQGQTSGGWTRDASKGHTYTANYAGYNPQTPERIYWSDAASPHTFIGYSKPRQAEGKNFDWTLRENTYFGEGTEGIVVYYGSLGDPTHPQTSETIDNKVVYHNYIDYTNADGDTPVLDDLAKPNGTKSYKSGNEKIKYDDLLLTYSTTKKAETGGSVAKLYFKHALAMIRVVVNIQGFSASTDAADSYSVVSDMVLKDMLTMYKWKQMSDSVEQLVQSYDQANINDIYNSSGSTVQFDQKKDTHLWIPRPDGSGTGTGKQFTFYGLAVPTTMSANSLRFEFKVKYPDPMNPWEADKITPHFKEHKYTANMPSEVKFSSGYCTTININLNHSNEHMTVGAEYMDWQDVETPDEGELKKNLTFLENTNRNSVTILGDQKATEDDATWLYVDTKDNKNKIKDIYGNDGSKDHPFKISTANQLLSFAYEVKGTDRTNDVEYQDISSTPSTTKTIPVNGGFDFTGYYVTLDADITMQKSLEGTDVTWLGIGDDTTDSEGKYIHAFNGVFNGGYRHINRLYGEPLFNTVGEDGVVDHIFITDAIGILGRGSIAEVNYGVICGAYIEGNVIATKDANTTGGHSDCCGSIVGENHSMLISCAHIGDITGTGYTTVGALLGYNDGIVAICYNCGNVTSTGSGVHTYAGIGAYSPRSIAYCSYFNGDLFHGHDYSDLNQRIGHVAYPLTTAQMQSNVFVNKEAPMDNTISKDHELFDDGLSGDKKNDPFFYHLSLNYGIRRAVAMLKRALPYDADPQGYIQIHGASGTADDPNRYEVLKLKKSLVQWLIVHYSTEKTPGGDLEFSHQFQFTPGTYPKLQ